MCGTVNIPKYVWMEGSYILEKNPTFFMSLDHHNFFLYSKYVSLFLQTSVPLTTHQRSLILQQMETIKTFHNCSNAENMCL